MTRTLLALGEQFVSLIGECAVFQPRILLASIYAHPLGKVKQAKSEFSNEVFEYIRPPFVPLLVGLLVVGTPVCVGVSARGARSRAAGVAVGLAGAAWVGRNDNPVSINRQLLTTIIINMICCLKICRIWSSTILVTSLTVYNSAYKIILFLKKQEHIL